MPREPRIYQATSEALNAFWAKIAEHYPEVTTGDLPPEISIRQFNASEEAVSWWVTYNKKTRYDHVLDLSFSIQTDLPPDELENLDPAHIRAAITRRLSMLRDSELVEAVLPSSDTLDRNDG